MKINTVTIAGVTFIVKYQDYEIIEVCLANKRQNIKEFLSDNTLFLIEKEMED